MDCTSKTGFFFFTLQQKAFMSRDTVIPEIDSLLYVSDALFSEEIRHVSTSSTDLS